MRVLQLKNANPILLRLSGNEIRIHTKKLNLFVAQILFNQYSMLRYTSVFFFLVNNLVHEFHIEIDAHLCSTMLNFFQYTKSQREHYFIL